MTTLDNLIMSRYSLIPNIYKIFGISDKVSHYYYYYYYYYYYLR